MPKQASKVTKKTEKAPSKGTSLSVEVYDLKGKVTEKITLPKAIFSVEENPKLVAQAVRVYLANKRQGTSSTKTRGEVKGSTRKIYRQKGTGRARHGGITAPIFVGGGITFGPKPRDYSLKLSQNMRRKALFSALTAQRKDGAVKVVSGFEKIEPKTKNATQALKSLSLYPAKGSVLLVIGNNAENVYRAARNIDGVEILPAKQLNAYEVIRAKTLLFMKDSIDSLSETFAKGKKHE